MAAAGRPPIKRADLPPGEVLCSYCTAKCCRYYALPIEKPDTLSDWEYVRWYVLHENTTVFKEGDTWYLLVHTTCQHLQPDNRCGIYETRPPICREYTTDACEYDDDSTYEQYLETPEQVSEYVEAILPRKGRDSVRSPRPPLLPLLA
jgi:Fe-S-cluster containining protein